VFTITEKAAEMAQKFMAEEGKQGWGMRIFQAGSSCCGPSYGIDLEENPAAGDAVYEKDGLRVFVDSNCGDGLDDMQMDYHEDGEMSGFVLNGETEPSCGAGGSDCSACGK